MGSEDLFHKRKAKAAINLGRRKAMRAPYDKVLIVCEGEKTEPNYFNELVEFYELKPTLKLTEAAVLAQGASLKEHWHYGKRNAVKGTLMTEFIVFLIKTPTLLLTKL